MSTLVLYVKNLRALRSMDWSPSDVCLLVGANGAGKSTALQALNFLRVVTDRWDPSEAVLVFGGAFDLKHRGASEADPIEIGLRRDNLDLRLRLGIGALGNFSIDATLYDGKQEVSTDTQSGPLHKLIPFLNPLDPTYSEMMDAIRRIVVFHDPDIMGLRGGSHVAHTKQLDSRGINAVTMLRAWFQRRPDRWRFEFVLTGLRAAFPCLVPFA